MIDHATFSFNFFFFSYVVPPMEQLCTLPLAAAYRFSQISELYNMKTQGNVSMLMWLLDAYACAGQL